MFFRDVITEMYKKEGFIISWKQQNTTLNLNGKTNLLTAKVLLFKVFFIFRFHCF